MYTKKGNRFLRNPRFHVQTECSRYSRRVLCRALGKEGFALGKAFAECCTRQRAVGISLHGKGFFAECFLSGTRQSLCRVRTDKNPKKWEKMDFLIGRGPHRPAPAHIRHFSRKFHSNAADGIRTRDLPCARTSSTTTPHCHLCLNSVLVPNILY